MDFNLFTLTEKGDRKNYPWSEDTPFTKSLKAIIKWQGILATHELHAGVFNCQVHVVNWFRESHSQCVPSLQQKLPFWCHMATSAMHCVHAAWTVVTLQTHHMPQSCC